VKVSLVSHVIETELTVDSSVRVQYNLSLLSVKSPIIAVSVTGGWEGRGE